MATKLYKYFTPVTVADIKFATSTKLYNLPNSDRVFLSDADAIIVATLGEVTDQDSAEIRYCRFNDTDTLSSGLLETFLLSELNNTLDSLAVDAATYITPAVGDYCVLIKAVGGMGSNDIYKVHEIVGTKATCLSVHGIEKFNMDFLVKIDLTAGLEVTVSDPAIVRNLETSTS